MFLFRRKKNLPPQIKKGPITTGLWTKCRRCGEVVYKKTLERSFKVCPHCQYHFPLSARERIDMLVDAGSFQEIARELIPLDPLSFLVPVPYREKLLENQKKTGLSDAIICGRAGIAGVRVALAATDCRFLMGSMGSVVGEKIARTCDLALAEKCPVVTVSGSGGGARMYEGCLSLMQMAKTSGAIARLNQAGLLYISVLTDPTMAGVLASFASLGDILIAEPGALIGFAGPRVIRETIRQDLPPDFQRSEFLLQHGLIDMIVARKELRKVLSGLIKFFSPGSPAGGGGTGANRE
jgi:acetyl-CoA carboxylase carboxyl transferase subunit beta